MASKVTRTALMAVSAFGASGLVAASAQAAAPTISSALVNQPAVTQVTQLTPESAVLNGVVDTGGNPGSVLTTPASGPLTWDGTVTLSAGKTYQVDGIPSDSSMTSTYPTSSPSTVLNNNGANNYSTVTFEYDPYSDYVANGNNPGPETAFANEVNVNTYPGLSSVAVQIGGYPASTATGLSGALTPGTKYVYFIEQQAGATDAAEDVNTFNGSATGTNPSYSCFPLSYISQVAPYNTYTPTGTLSGGVNSSGAAQTTPQPQIQGPCVYYYGGGANYYTSPIGTFTTPKLGVVKAVRGAVSAKGRTASAAVIIEAQSVEKAAGSIQLTYAGKKVGYAKFSVSPQSTKSVSLSLTGYGKTLIYKGKRFTSKVVITTTTDQPSGTTSITL